MGGLSRLVGLTGGVVLNHSFLITLLDTSSGDGALALSILKSIAFDLLLGASASARAWTCRCRSNSTRKAGTTAGR